MLIFGVDIPLWVTLLIVLCFIIYWHSTSKHDTFKKIGVPNKTPSRIPYIGNLFSIISQSIPDQDMENRELFPGKIYGTFMGSTPNLNVADVEFLKEVTIKQFNKFRNHQALIEGEDNIHSRHVGTLYDDHWKHVRSILTPIFTSGKLKQMVPVIKNCADKLVNHLRSTEAAPITVKDYTGGYTMDVIASTAFGMDIDTQSTTNHPFIVNASLLMGVKKVQTVKETIIGIFNLCLIMLFPKFLRLFICNYFGHSIVNSECSKYFDDVVDKFLKEREKDGVSSERKDFVAVCSKKLVDLNDVDPSEIHTTRYGIKWTTAGLTRKDFTGNAAIFLIAGYETTASALQFFLYNMATHPDIQERLYAEITQVIGNSDFTYEQIQQLEYLDWCVLESLRIHPPAPRLNRISNEETVIKSLIIPKGTVINGLVYAIHHDPAYWPEPELYKPERFSAANKTEDQQYAWLPFGAGNRGCLATRLALLEIKIAVIKLLTAFSFEKTAETPAANDLKFAPFTGFLVTNAPLKLSAVSRS